MRGAHLTVAMGAPLSTPDVLVAGAGPAGRALAGACAALGLRTALVDPAPDRPWRATYGAWVNELPAGLDAVVRARARGRAVARTTHDLGWDYAVLDTAALRAHLDNGLTGVSVYRGRVVEVDDDQRVGWHLGGRTPVPPVDGDSVGRAGRRAHGRRPAVVVLADGSRLRAGVVVDASGAGGLALHGRAEIRRARGGSPPPAGADITGIRSRSSRGVTAARQTAYGLVVPAALAAPLVCSGWALFMDWRPDHGEKGWPTFLYGAPYGDGTVLLEETSLAHRPGMPVAELGRRLHARLARHDVRLPETAPVERVRIPLDPPPSQVRPAFGAATPLTHPATGFGLAAALRLAPAVAAALCCDDPYRAADRLLRSPAARLVHALRLGGLAALLRMPPERVPDFFETFFQLPARHRWNYLTARDNPIGVAAAMAAIYRRTDWPMRARLTIPGEWPVRG